MLESVIVRLDDALGLVGLVWERGADLAGRHAPAMWDVNGGRPGVALGVTGRGGRLGVVRRWDVKNIELTASRGLYGGIFGRIMGDMVAIDDIVVPISMAGHKGRSLELECSFPTSLLRTFGERELALVVVPRAKQVNCLYVRGRAKSEIHLNRRHRDKIKSKPWILGEVEFRRKELLISVTALLADQLQYKLEPWGFEPMRYEQEEWIKISSVPSTSDKN